MPAPPTDATAALYLTVANDGTEDDRLVAAYVPFAQDTELHEGMTEGDRTRMVRLDAGIVIPAGAIVRLAPGGLHVMALDLTEQPTVGTEFDVELRFERAGTVTLTARVVDFAEADLHHDSFDDDSHEDDSGDGDSHRDDTSDDHAHDDDDSHEDDSADHDSSSDSSSSS